jgi:D-alanyl-D-alanine carboxypeptidase
VIDGANDRALMQVASLSKIITALAVVDALDAGTDVPVSLRAEGMPARKINMKAGQVWTLEDSLASMLLSSANDAAVALAERASGSLEAFEDRLFDTAERLGLQDGPILHDPSGLDDEFSVAGGNLLSARDLAIATRAALADPRVAPVVATREYRFVGGDDINHRLINHNRLLRTYPGAVGVKTGYTKKSGRCLVAAATRDGRTMIVVVLDVYDIYGFAAAQMDRGFATPPGAGNGEQLPAPPAAQAPDESGALVPLSADPVRTSFGEDVRRHRELLAGAAAVLAVGVLWARARRRRAWRGRRLHARRRSPTGTGAPPAPRGAPGATSGSPGRSRTRAHAASRPARRSLRLRRPTGDRGSEPG